MYFIIHRKTMSGLPYTTLTVVSHVSALVTQPRRSRAFFYTEAGLIAQGQFAKKKNEKT